METLVQITQEHGVHLDMRYATANNIVGKAFYRYPGCFLRPQAAEKLLLAVQLARQLNLTLSIFDAYRPREGQEQLWLACPDPQYIIPPEQGSSHSRGIALDLTLLESDGCQLEMGSGFDDMSELSHHGCTIISAQAQNNRFLLRGLMATAGFTTLKTEWWHYHLEGEWQLIDQALLPQPLV